MATPQYNLGTLTPRQRKLARNHITLHELCERSKKITYSIGKQLKSNPPEGYHITYLLRSIIGIEASKAPIYGDKHEVYIEFPENYPSKEAKLTIKMISEIWHPNVRCHGAHKGRMCVNEKALSASHPLDSIVVMMGEILQYKNYLAENVPPFPEDEVVAAWVRDYAEPNGIVDLKRKIYTDYDELLEPEPGFGEERPILPSPPRIAIVVRPRTPKAESENQPSEPNTNERVKIKIIK